MTQSVGSVEIRRDVEGLGSQLSVLYTLDLERAELTARAVVTDHIAAMAAWIRFDEVRCDRSFLGLL